MCKARKGVKDLPISAQDLPAIPLEGLPSGRPSRRVSGGFIRRLSGGLAAVRLAGLISNP